MAYQTLEVPEYHEFLDVLGVAPELIEGEDAQCLKVEANDEILTITFDIPGRSFCCKWSLGPRILTQVFREGAIRLRIRSDGSARFICVDFETDSDRGHVEIQVFPVFAVRDRTLLR